MHIHIWFNFYYKKCFFFVNIEVWFSDRPYHREVIEITRIIIIIIIKNNHGLLNLQALAAAAAQHQHNIQIKNIARKKKRAHTHTH